ncbi:unnamed protein product [Callosobruchus maculatus]|nr:unnamed protein product [Callosobruchus maculatus]
MSGIIDCQESERSAGGNRAVLYNMQRFTTEELFLIAMALDDEQRQKRFKKRTRMSAGSQIQMAPQSTVNSTHPVHSQDSNMSTEVDPITPEKAVAAATAAAAAAAAAATRTPTERKRKRKADDTGGGGAGGGGGGVVAGGGGVGAAATGAAAVVGAGGLPPGIGPATAGAQTTTGVSGGVRVRGRR